MKTFFIPNQAAFDAITASEEPVKEISIVASPPPRATGYRKSRRGHRVRGYRRKDGTFVSSHTRKG